MEWVGFTPEHVEADLELFRGRTAQYVHQLGDRLPASPARLPLTESAPLDNSNWEYARAKIACEHGSWRPTAGAVPGDHRAPFAYVRQDVLAGSRRYTVIDRMRKGKKVVVPGMGPLCGGLTHHTDFAKGLVGLLGNSLTLGEAFHITTDEVLTGIKFTHCWPAPRGSKLTLSIYLRTILLHWIQSGAPAF